MEGLLSDAKTVGENPTLALNMFARTKRLSKTSFVLISKLLFITKYKIINQTIEVSKVMKMENYR